MDTALRSLSRMFVPRKQGNRISHPTAGKPEKNLQHSMKSCPNWANRPQNSKVSAEEEKKASVRPDRFRQNWTRCAADAKSISWSWTQSRLQRKNCSHSVVSCTGILLHSLTPEFPKRSSELPIPVTAER